MAHGSTTSPTARQAHYHVPQPMPWPIMGSTALFCMALGGVFVMNGSSGGWVGLARIALQRDQNAEAAEILKRLLATDPEDRTFRQLLALAEPGAAGATEGAPLGEEDTH